MNNKPTGNLRNANGPLRLSHPAVETPFRLVHLSDFQLSMPGRKLDMDARDAYYNSDRPRSLGKGDDTVLATIEQANRLNPDLVLISGDIIDSFTELNLKFAQEILATFKGCVRFTIGNHDICRFRPPNQWEKAIPGAMETWLERFRMPSFTYTFMHGGVRFIALNTACATIDDDQLDWLEAVLATAPELPTILMHHVPLPIPELLPDVQAKRGKYYCMDRVPTTQRFMRIVENSSCLLAAFCGHLHFDSAYRLGTMLQTTVGCAFMGGMRVVEIGS